MFFTLDFGLVLGRAVVEEASRTAEIGREDTAAAAFNHAAARYVSVAFKN